MRTFEEGDHGDEGLVPRVAVPLREDDRVFGLRGRVLGVAVQQDHLGQVAVEVF